MRRKRGQRGFTLIEMLISLSIFAVITAMAVANFRAGAQGDELRVSARLVASTVRRAQTQAVAGYSIFFCHGGADEGKVCPSGNDSECGGGVCTKDIPDAWGVRISTLSGENRELIVFADTNGSKRYESGEAVRFDAISSGPFVNILSVTPNDANVLDIIFEPPKPKMYFNDSIVNGIATIVLEHQHTGTQQSVTVNRISGLVSVE
ncbi:MAG: prepilin-type N-terminal cleavage/methylation domain-containing protein [Patescibacteria group bacterium]|nr:prepilin-type N-terminal cleavage/methylation domain-containing protein [Patescibacteria group bacterium]